MMQRLRRLGGKRCGMMGLGKWTFGLGLLLQASAAVAQEPQASSVVAPAKEHDTTLGLRFDCLHNFNVDKGSTQECVRISGLRVSLRDQVSPQVYARLSIDPFQTPDSAKMNTPLRDQLPTSRDTSLWIIDQFALTWIPRPHIEVAIQSFDGATLIPSVSGLATANSLSSSGWRQTALTVAYHLTLPTPVRITLIGGDGEGQTVTNATPQQYFGLQAEATLLPGLRLTGGLSLNGNDAGSEETAFLLKRSATRCGTSLPAVQPKQGHSARRYAVGLVVDGALAGIEGLQIGLSWQRNLVSDLGHQHPGYPTLAELQQNTTCSFDPDTFFPEQDGKLNTVRRTVYDFGFKYRMFGSYFVAGAVTSRRLTTGGVEAFQVCDSFDGHRCTGITAPPRSQINQSAYSLGTGVDLASGLALTVEYFNSSFDKAYAQVYYDGQNGKATSELELFNARLAYRWQ
ncbi:MAG: hypothetical protein NTZ90_03970 [Proteobacteria bacterium]|nr:hypothetical protein [Pseudomonadota bacterium]